MRRMVVLAVLVAAAAGFAGSEATNDQIEKEILKVEEERSQALLKGDVDKLRNLYSDQLAYCTEHGKVLTLDQHLANIKDRKQVFHSSVHKDVKVHVFENGTVAVTGLSVSDVRYPGQKADPRPRRYTNAWMKQDGQWKCIVHYETPVEQP